MIHVKTIFSKFLVWKNNGKNLKKVSNYSKKRQNFWKEKLEVVLTVTL